MRGKEYRYPLMGERNKVMRIVKDRQGKASLLAIIQCSYAARFRPMFSSFHMIYARKVEAFS